MRYTVTSSVPDEFPHDRQLIALRVYTGSLPGPARVMRPSRLLTLAILASGALLVPGKGAAQIEVTSRDAVLRVGGQLDLHYIKASADARSQTFRIRRGWITLNARYSDFLEAVFVTDLPNDATVLDAQIRLRFDKSFRVTFGRFKRSFDIFVLNSISDVQFLERAGGIPGYDGCDGVGAICSYGRLSEGLLFANRDSGVRLDGQVGRFKYQASLTNGTKNGALDDNGHLSSAARLAFPVAEAFTIGVNATRKDFNVSRQPFHVDYAKAWGTDIQYGTWRDGLFVQAAYLRGQNWKSAKRVGNAVPWFSAMQVQGSWYLPWDSDRIEGVEPMVRVSIADSDKQSYMDADLLFTPGFAAYFRGRSRVSANIDLYRSSEDGTFWALRVGTLLYF